MADLHYDELTAWFSHRRSLRLGQLACTAGLLLGLYLSLGAREPMHKLLFSAATLGAGATGLALAKQDEQISARLQDAEDIGLDAWQDRLFRLYRPQDAKLSAAPVADPPIPLFDWSALANADEHPVLGIIAPMGGGKTRLCKFLARHVLGVAEIRVNDIYARVKDWPGCPVRVEYADMVEAMKAEVGEIQADVARYRSGVSDFPGVLTVMEEGADTLLSLKQADEDLTAAWLQKYTTVVRKIRRRLCVVSVKLNGVDFGTGAESRNDATIVFPGSRGVAKAMTDDRVLKLGTKQNADLRERLKASLQGIQRPALIYCAGQWYPASIPDLNEQGDLIGMTQPEPMRQLQQLELLPQAEPDQRSQLERAFTLPSADEHPIEGVIDEPLSPDLRRLADYIQKKQRIAVGAIKQNWGKNNKFSAKQIDEFLIELMRVGLIETYTPDGKQGEWVMWVNRAD